MKFPSGLKRVASITIALLATFLMNAAITYAARGESSYKPQTETSRSGPGAGTVPTDPPKPRSGPGAGTVPTDPPKP